MVVGAAMPSHLGTMPQSHTLSSRRKPPPSPPFRRCHAHCTMQPGLAPANSEHSHLECHWPRWITAVSSKSAPLPHPVRHHLSPGDIPCRAPSSCMSQCVSLCVDRHVMQEAKEGGGDEWKEPVTNGVHMAACKKFIGKLFQASLFWISSLLNLKALFF